MRGKRAKEIRKVVNLLMREVVDKAYQEVNIRQYYSTSKDTHTIRTSTIKLIEVCKRRVYQMSKTRYKRLL